MKREIEKRNMLIMYPHLIVSFNFIYSLAFNAIGKEKQNKNPEILKGKKKRERRKILLPIFLLNIPQEKGERSEGAGKNWSQAVTEILAIDTRRISIVTISTSRGQQVRSQATAANMVAITIS